MSVEHSSPPRCECSGTLQWEATRDRRGERWLATCSDCERLLAFVLGQPAFEHDPLRGFLLGDESYHPAEPSPPWQRFIRLTGGPPWFVRWRLRADKCPRCGVKAQAVRSVCFDGRSRSRYAVCLACGHTEARLTDVATGDLRAMLEGNAWTPPCPAVKRMRLDVFAAWRLMSQFGAWPPPSEPE